MALSVVIDSHSGFCGGVIRAIGRAEKFLETQTRLHSLGSIVHNEAELARLSAKGLVTISDMSELSAGETVFIRAHGEPPETYARAEALGLNVIDCTCPVVLQLQKSIQEAYSHVREAGGQVVIFGKVGHAEVLGLVGQVGGDALVVENMQMLHRALESGRISGPVELFSQTTKSPREYEEIGEALKKVVGEVTVHDTICRQVASRHSELAAFAEANDVIVFVSGRESSNGKVLFELCRSRNPRCHRVGNEDELCAEWFRDGDKVGVCGATSTPKWLLEAVANKILQVL